MEIKLVDKDGNFKENTAKLVGIVGIYQYVECIVEEIKIDRTLRTSYVPCEAYYHLTGKDSNLTLYAMQVNWEDRYWLVDRRFNIIDFAANLFKYPLNYQCERALKTPFPDEMSVKTKELIDKVRRRLKC